MEKIWVEDEELSLGHAELQNVYLILGRDVNQAVRTVNLELEIRIWRSDWRYKFGNYLHKDGI